MEHLGHRRAVLRLASACLAAPLVSAQQASYRDGIEKWRRDRETSLRSETGWTTLVGLHWLEEGRPRTDIAEGLRFTLSGGQVTARSEGGAQLNGQPFREGPLRDDTPGPADMLRIGTRTYFVIERGDRIGVRVRDTASRYRVQFRGLAWYPVRDEYRVTGRMIPHAAPRMLAVPTIIDGLSQQMESRGVVEFTLGGQTLRLEPVVEGDELFFMFRDQTAGKTTYAAGRFLYTPMPKDGIVDLDFNRAYNPPCAYTPFATCPLPPPQNRLSAAIEAGELDYHHE